MFASKGRRLLLLGGIAVVALASASLLIMSAGKGSTDSQATVTRAPAQKATSARPAAGASSGAAAAKQGDAVAAKPGSAGKRTTDAGAFAANASDTKATMSQPPTTAPEVPATDETPSEDSVFERSSYTYRSLGRKDPFQSLIVAKDGAERLFSEKLDPELIELVGVLTNGGERRALVEDVHGFGYVLKEGDRVLRGRVTSIGEESMKIRHTMYGVTETTTLSLVQKSQGRGLPNDRLR